MTRVPIDDPGLFEQGGIANRLASGLRRHVLAAAQASLRALRELLAQLPTKESGARPTKIEPSSPRPAADRAGILPVQKANRPRSGVLPSPPPADLLQSDATLPGSYGSDRLVLLARDPHCLYAYWDLSDAHCRSVRTQAGADRLRTVLRTYDVTQVSFDAKPPTRFQDFTIVGDARSVYAYVGKPAACYVAEIGYLRHDGVFFPLARSQPVWTPRTGQPGTAPGRWMTVGWSEHREAREVVPLATTAPGSVGIGPGATESPVTAARQGPSSWPSPSPSAAQRGSWSLVRGRLTTATSPDDPPAARNEP
jgi:hypothetical protein